MKFKRYQKIFDISGTPVLMHWSLTAIIVFSFLCIFLKEYSFIIGVIAFWVMLFSHEFGHYFVAKKLGYEVEEIKLYPFHGICSYEAPDTESDEFKVSIAGVIVQFTISIPLLVLYYLLKPESWWVITIILVLGSFNFLMALLNLAPFKGFDGYVIWKFAWPKLVPEKHKKTPRSLSSAAKETPEEIVKKALENAKK